MKKIGLNFKISLCFITKSLKLVRLSFLWKSRACAKEISARWSLLSLLFFSCSVMSNSLWPHGLGLKHTRLPSPSLSLGVCPNSYPLSQWIQLILCHPLLLLPSIFPNIRVFSNESALCIKWLKYWSIQLQCQSFQWIFRVDFL